MKVLSKARFLLQLLSVVPGHPTLLCACSEAQQN